MITYRNFFIKPPGGLFFIRHDGGGLTREGSLFLINPYESAILSIVGGVSIMSWIWRVSLCPVVMIRVKCSIIVDIGQLRIRFETSSIADVSLRYNFND